jgi:uncharacterized lipoprotein YmbA
MREVTISLTSVLICACASSPPARFFVLDPIAPSGAIVESAADPVQIASVHMPSTLDRREIVREEVANKLTISHQDLWGAPLPDMTQRVLSQDLMLRLPAGQVILPQQPAPADTSSISVDILQFGIDATGTVVLDGSWSIVPSGSEVAAASYRFQLSQRAVAGDYADQARVMSELLGQLADSIVHQLHTRSAG